MNLWDLSWNVRLAALERALAEARGALSRRSDDGEAMAALGRWYAFRGVWDRAIDAFDKARAGGGRVSSLELARCCWSRGDRAASDLDRAKTEFQAALERGEAPRPYLELCLRGVDRKPNEKAKKRIGMLLSRSLDEFQRGRELMDRFPVETWGRGAHERLTEKFAKGGELTGEERDFMMNHRLWVRALREKEGDRRKSEEKPREP